MSEKRKYCVVISIFLMILLTASAISGAGVFINRNSAILELLDPKNMDKNENQVDAIIASMNQQPSNSENVIEDDCGCGGGSVYIAPEGGLSSEDIVVLQERGEKEGWTFTVGENSATKYPLEVLCGYIVDDEDQGGTPFDHEPLDSLPDVFNWKDPNHNPTGRNCMTPIKNQGGCGACWAFSTCGVVESAINIIDGDELDLSEQHLVSCNTGGYGCNGGSTCYKYYEWEEDACGVIGAVLEPDFPYQASQVPCNCPHPRAYKIDDYGSVGSGPGVPVVDDIKQAIYDYGPVSAGIHVNSAFYGYTGGVFNNNEPGISHSVVLVGWDDNQGSGGVWFLRNSWGTGWGEDGYMRIEYGCCDVGESTKYIEYSGMEKQDLYGNQYEACYGDIQDYGAHSIRMSQSILDSGYAVYVFDLGVDDEDVTIHNDLHIGVYYDEWGLIGSGPHVYIYNWNTWSYDLLKSNLGNVGARSWRWVGTFDSNQYVYDGNNEIWVKIYADANDDIILDTVAIKYTPVPKIPDLECYNVNLDWTDVTPGSTVTGSLEVENIGDLGSELNWHVDYWPPDWGTWTFDPSSGTGLKPEDGPVTVQVSVVAPNQYGQTYTGDVWLRNTDDEWGDYCILPTSLSTAPDTNPPETYIDSGPSGTINYNDVTFTWHGSDDVTQSGDLVYSYKLEGYTGSWSSWTSSTSKGYYDLSDGGYTFKVKAKDEAGNEDPTPATRSFTVSMPNPTPDLDCSGSLNWIDVPPGSTVTGSFTVENIGDPGSELDWEITEWPSWGSWDFDPNSGNNLKPEDGTVTVNVEVVAPDQQCENFTGEVKVINTEDSNDFDIIYVILQTTIDNDPPTVPIITGPASGEVSVSYEFTIVSTDPDGDDVYYYIDWDDGNVEDWIGPYASGVVATVSHSWSSGDTYSILAKAKDEHGAESDWSDPFIITIVENAPPGAPVITGENNGAAGTSYEYGFTSIDPDGDDIITGPFASGAEATASHTWDEQGDYTITAKAKDINGLIGPEGTLPISMPKARFVHNPLFLRFLEQFPNAFPILRQLLGL